MAKRSTLALLAAFLLTQIAAAQAPGLLPTAGAGLPASPAPGPVPDAATSPSAAASRLPVGASSPNPAALDPGLSTAAVQVTTGSGQLPNEHGQIYRQYNITPYTSRVTTTNRPEQAIIDWILRETGYETWHSEPLAILSANAQVLRVYHTPQVQAAVKEIVERFNSQAEAYAFSLRVMTVESPSWRARMQRLMIPVQVQTPGTQAWLMEREGAALLVADLRRRGDFREYNPAHQTALNGQPIHLDGTAPGRAYVRNVATRAEIWPGFQPETAAVDEGYQLEFVPLLSTDGRSLDAMIKCQIDQVEKMVPVMLDVPTAAAPRQQTKIEVPQMSHFRFHERFRWPSDQVLLVSMGVIAVPVPGQGKVGVAGISLPFPGGPARADLLVMVESKGKAGPSPQVTRGTRPEGAGYFSR